MSTGTAIILVLKSMTLYQNTAVECDVDASAALLEYNYVQVAYNTIQVPLGHVQAGKASFQVVERFTACKTHVNSSDQCIHSTWHFPVRFNTLTCHRAAIGVFTDTTVKSAAKIPHPCQHPNLHPYQSDHAHLRLYR